MERVDLCSRATEVVAEVGAYLRQHWGRVEDDHHSVKPHPTHHDVVTVHDHAAEERLRDGLAAIDASIGFTGEEGGCHKQADRYWLVDPIDGTDAFLRGLPFSTTQLALIEDGRPVIGIIYDFVRDEMVYAAEGNGAFCNGQPIQVSDRDLRTGRVVIEISVRDKPANQRILMNLHCQAVLMKCCASGWELIQVACGRMEGKIFCKPWAQPLDIAPGAVIIQEAGGVVANIGSSVYDFCNTDVIATNPLVYAQLTKGKDALFPLGLSSLVV